MFFLCHCSQHYNIVTTHRVPCLELVRPPPAVLIVEHGTSYCRYSETRTIHLVAGAPPTAPSSDPSATLAAAWSLWPAAAVAVDDDVCPSVVLVVRERVPLGPEKA